MTIPLPWRRSNSILLTSLVDVMFVLLFFFMLTTASVDRQAMRLEATRSASDGGPETEVSLSLLGPTHWRLGDQDIAPVELESALLGRGVTRVLVAPVPGVSLQVLTDAIGRLRAAGVSLQLSRQGSQ